MNLHRRDIARASRVLFAVTFAAVALVARGATPQGSQTSTREAPAAPTATALPSTSAAGKTEDVTQADILHAIESISEKTIEVARQDAEHANSLFNRLVWFVGALGAALAIFGISSITGLKKAIRSRATAQVSEALETMAQEIRQTVEKTNLMAEHGRDLFLYTAEATRFYNLADGFAQASSDKREYYNLAKSACLRSRAAAKALEDVKQIAWTYSFEAICLSDLGDYVGAIAAAEESERLWVREDATLHYNIACYCCLAGFDERGAARLRKAFVFDSDGSLKLSAPEDPDFKRWRDSGLFPELVGTAKCPA